MYREFVIFSVLFIHITVSIKVNRKLLKQLTSLVFYFILPYRLIQLSNKLFVNHEILNQSSSPS